MKIECNVCHKVFDDEYYVLHNNKIGWEYQLLLHLKQHEDQTKISYNFTNVDDV